jgi:hypothetical protein
MATNREPMTDAEVKDTRKQVTHLMRHPRQHHPSAHQPPVIHYALDLESPPLLACNIPEQGTISSPTASEVTCPDCMATEHFPAHYRQAQVQDPTDPPIITANDVLMTAADLLVDANHDYTKAIVDLTSALIGAGPNDTILMTRILRSLAQGD